MEENTEQRIDLTLFSEKIQGLKERIASVIVGQEQTVDLVLTAILANGHVLIEGVTGVAKMLLARLTARLIDADFSRIQFTPDLLPSDITGVNFFNVKKSEFEFVPGPIFANIVLADEINRATPKTQSGLLECMEEIQATIDGKTYKLAQPFMVVATQNPVENMGTFPLPEAQLDRFLMKGRMEYPTHEEGVAILDRFDRESPLDTLSPVVTAEEHNIIGGLGSAVAETLAENCPVPMVRVGVRDSFGRSGKVPELLALYGLTPEALCDAARRAVAAKKTGKTERNGI